MRPAPLLVIPARLRRVCTPGSVAKVPFQSGVACPRSRGHAQIALAEPFRQDVPPMSGFGNEPAGGRAAVMFPDPEGMNFSI